MPETKTRRYMTPLKYKDGAGKEKTTKVYFELDPVEFMDWAINNPFDANELQAGLSDIRDAGLEEADRDLTRDEVTAMLNVIKLLVQISAGRPTDDDEYFLKDPNWISSYVYRSFRTFLLSNPKEMDQFLTTLLDNDIMAEFTAQLAKANENIETRATAPGSMSDEDLRKAYNERIASKNAETAAPTSNS